jgi:hypothetical protein
MRNGNRHLVRPAIAAGHSDHTVKAISGYSTTRMLQRCTHPTDALKVQASETFAVPNADGRNRAESKGEPREKVGGR